MTIDISNFFLSSEMSNPEFMKIHKNDIPNDIHNRYDSTKFMDKNGYVYFKIIKGMYGLKQAAILAYNQLKNNLENMGISPFHKQLECGSTRQDVQNFVFVLMTLEYNIIPKPMPITSSMLYKNSMQSQSIGQANTIVA